MKLLDFNYLVWLLNCQLRVVYHDRFPAICHLSIMKMSPMKNQSQKKISVLFTKPTIKIKRSLSRKLQANRQAMKIFLKEAKLINSLRHVNVVGFKRLCTLPCAIMLEYVAFDFSRFGHSKLSTNLGDFLNNMDRVDGFDNL